MSCAKNPINSWNRINKPRECLNVSACNIGTQDKRIIKYVPINAVRYVFAFNILRVNHCTVLGEIKIDFELITFL